MISVRNLTLDLQTHEGSRRVLDDISLELADGEFVALMGANGSGKTSLARCLNGIYLPTSGEVNVDGLDTRDAKALPEIRRRLGLVFQNPDDQIVAPAVEREIAFGPENLGVPRPEMRRRVEAMLKLFRLEAYRQQAPHLLSGGEKQRLALAAVMAMQPRHLVFDEPTSLLDYESRCQLLELMAQLVASSNPFSVQPLTLLMITQFAEEALFAQRLLVLDHGRLVMNSLPREIFMRVDALQQIGLHPPIEFLAHHESPEHPIEDFLLTPIL
ncbi:ATP-binding cassette domain-containing protein [candidate division KSB1 bacterium]|nr:ATP-binding cassette domain-containing protein [candidate division KSB1 bacterium]